MEKEKTNVQNFIKEKQRSATLANLLSLRYVAMAFIPMAALMLYIFFNTITSVAIIIRSYIIVSSAVFLVLFPPPTVENEIGTRHKVAETIYGVTISLSLILLNGMTPLYHQNQSLFIMTMFALAAFFRIPHRKSLILFPLLGIVEALLLVQNSTEPLLLNSGLLLCAVVSVVSLLLSRMIYARWEKAFTTQRLIEAHRHELQRKERELRESERKYRVLVENFPNGIVAMFDHDLRFHLADGKGLEHLGLGSCTLKNQLIWDCLTPETSSVLGPLFRKTLSGKESTAEVELMDRTCELHLLPLHDSEGRINAGMVVSMDVTERKRAEALREDVERMTRHDIKTPLNAIMGMADLLLEEELPEDIQEGLKIIRKSGFRVFNIVNQSLNMLKMERGTYHYHSLPVNLLKLIQKIWEETKHLARARQVGVDLTLNGKTPEESSRFIVQGEELLCYTMLANLIKNAVEASPRGGTISVNLSDRETWKKIRIRNLGEVPKEIRDKFFDKFTTHGKPGGTGLGAYSARLIARTLGGSITLDTSISGETVLTVVLPG
jgi:PAS domain S-box-containing protein